VKTSPLKNSITSLLNRRRESSTFSDVGNASLGPENTETKMTQSGTPLVGVAIVPSGANYLDISTAFTKSSLV
jgi:hypothetical protein